MPKRLTTLFLTTNKDDLEQLCKEKGLNDYETEIIMRIYWKKQSLNFIADTMEFDKFGKVQKYYSLRTIKTIHKEAYLKLMISKKE